MRVLRFCNLCDADFIAGMRKARFCPDCRGEQRRLIQVRASWKYMPFGSRERAESCVGCGGTIPEHRTRYCTDQCRNRADNYHKNHRRRNAARVTDMTPELEQELRRKARKCPCCGVFMVSKPYTDRSKELNHRLGFDAGGTHTRSNVRIICRKCNLARPKDCSDIPIQLSFVDTASATLRQVRTKGRRLRRELTPFEEAQRATRKQSRRRNLPSRRPPQFYPSTALLDQAITTLHRSGLGQKAISRRLNIGRDTVRLSYSRNALAAHPSLHEVAA